MFTMLIVFEKMHCLVNPQPPAFLASTLLPELLYMLTKAIYLPSCPTYMYMYMYLLFLSLSFSLSLSLPPSLPPSLPLSVGVLVSERPGSWAVAGDQVILAIHGVEMNKMRYSQQYMFIHVHVHVLYKFINSYRVSNVYSRWQMFA